MFTNPQLERAWKELLQQAETDPVCREDLPALWDTDASDEARGEVWTRFLASPAGRRLLDETDPAPALDARSLAIAEKEIKAYFRSREGVREPVEEPTSGGFLGWIRDWFSEALAPEPIVARASAVQTHLRLLTPRGDVPCYPYTFVWEPVDGATSYQFELIDGELETLWSGETTASELPFPGDLDLPRVGETYIWRVKARSDTTLASSSARFTPQRFSR